MPQGDSRQTIPTIERVQHNVAETGAAFDSVDVDTQHTDDFEHEGASARIVLSNGNWIEYHRRADDTIIECAFVVEESADGEPEGLLDSRLKLHDLDVTDQVSFLETVAESVVVYERDIETVGDAEQLWENIVPAVDG